MIPKPDPEGKVLANLADKLLSLSDDECMDLSELFIQLSELSGYIKVDTADTIAQMLDD